MTRALAVRALVAFLVWNLLVWPVLPMWAGGVAVVTEFLWDLITPHGQSLSFVSLSPILRWRWVPLDIGATLAPALLTWNVVLYLTVWSVVPSVPRTARARWIAVAIPVLGVWHVGDLLLTIESHLLTLTRPGSYDLVGGLDLWFLWVKFANNLNVLGLRQAVPLMLLAAQWLRWRSDVAADRPID